MFMPGIRQWATRLAVVALATAGTAVAVGAPAEAARGPVLGEFGADRGWSPEFHYRWAADITNDGCADIVGIAHTGVLTAVSRCNGTFNPAQFVLSGFGIQQGWFIGSHPRFLTDIDRDGLPDIVGRAGNDVWTSLANGFGGFAPARFQPGIFSGGVNEFYMADVNHDLQAELIGVGNHRIEVATSRGGGTFDPADPNNTTEFAHNDGLNDANFMFADVTGDGAAELLAMPSTPGVPTALTGLRSTTPRLNRTYGPTRPAGAEFPDGRNRLPDQVARTTNDSSNDLVIFEDRMYLATSLSEGEFAGAREIANVQIGDVHGYTDDRHIRLMKDITGDGFDDVVGFGETNTWVAIANGNGTYQALKFASDDFAFNDNYRVDRNPRVIADVNGDGRGDVVGFANLGVTIGLGQASGIFR
jgi:hypothetical protein